MCMSLAEECPFIVASDPVIDSAFCFSAAMRVICAPRPSEAEAPTGGGLLHVYAQAAMFLVGVRPGDLCSTAARQRQKEDYFLFAFSLSSLVQTQ